MNPHYNQNYTREEINAILAKIKSCVEKNRYTISMNENRQENIDFINEYNIRSNKQKSILLQIKTEDFCHSLQNTKIGFEYEILYVLVPQVQLFNAEGKEETVDVYTKFNVIALGTAHVIFAQFLTSVWPLKIATQWGQTLANSTFSYGQRSRCADLLNSYFESTR